MRNKAMASDGIELHREFVNGRCNGSSEISKSNCECKDKESRYVRRWVRVTMGGRRDSGLK